MAKGKNIAFDVFGYFLLAVFAIVFVIPFVWMISSSLKADYEIFTFPPKWIPNVFHWENYANALTAFPFFLYVKNTLYVVLGNIVGTLISSTMAGYAFARLKTPLKNFWFSIVILTMFFPGAVLRIPNYVTWNFLGLVDTLWPLILPAWMGSAFNIFLLRQFFTTIPMEIEESARIEGASRFYIIVRIMVPLIVPVIITVVIFTFRNCWNDFETPLIYLNNRSLYTVSLGLNVFKSKYGVKWSNLMAASVVVALPSVLLYAFLQKYFTEGLLIGGVKG